MMNNDDKRSLDVVAGILWRDGRYLAARRPEGKPFAGRWEFPGGKVEPGEDRAQALVRELAEELGVTAREPVFWRDCEHEYDHCRVRLHFFHVRDFTGEPRSLEGHELKWVTPEEALSCDFLEADTDVVRCLAHDDPSSSEPGTTTSNQ